MIRVRRGTGFTLLEVLIRLVVVFLIGLAAFLIGRGAGGGVGVVPPSDGTWVERTMIWNLLWEQWLHYIQPEAIPEVFLLTIRT